MIVAGWDLPKIKCGSLWGAIVWTLWCHRNNIICQHILDLDLVMDTIKYKTRMWLEAKVNDFHFSYFEWYSNISTYMPSKAVLLWMLHVCNWSWIL